MQSVKFSKANCNQRWPLLNGMSGLVEVPAPFRLGQEAAVTWGRVALVSDTSHVLWPGMVVMTCGWFMYLRKRICGRSRALGRVLGAILGDNQEPSQVVIKCLLCLTRHWKTQSETKGP